MLPPGLKTPREVTLYYDSVYDKLIDSGEAFPFLYPWAGLGAFLILGYLLVDHRQRPTLRWLRYPLFGFLLAFQAWVIMTNRAKHPAGAFGVGLLSAWGTMWVATVMVINDCQTDFTRLERTDVKEALCNGELVKDSSIPNGTLSHATTAASDTDATKLPDKTKPGVLQWQQYPISFRERLDWVADVFCSFRGVGWNWQTTTVPPPPKSIESQLNSAIDSANSEQMTTSKTGIRRFSNKESLLENVWMELIIGYLALDLIKVLISHDAYFWGYIDAPPPGYLPSFMQSSQFIVKSYRLLISLAAIHTALWEIFKVGPLFFCGILGPKWIGLRGEAWMNPADMYGSFRCVLDNGIAGWWGGWWHQAFRVAFQSHSTWLLDQLGIEKRPNTGRVISLFVSFFLSGCLHACGSYTQLGDTRPLMGPMRFFLLQPFAVIFQMLAAHQLSKFGILQKVPKTLRRVSNLVLVHIWLYYTAPLLMDDFARGGIWCFEPIAISPLRALGLGAKDDTWFCWWDGFLFWRSGKHWWDTGIAL